MAEDEHYAPHLFDPRSPQAGELPYPTQSKKKPDDTNLAGELRGYYGKPQFNPKSSRFGNVRKNPDGTDKRHGGVDIYAAFFPFPHETAVYAICKGRVKFVYDNDSPNDIGNRAWLYPDHAPNERIIYGHLNRFVGHDRHVEKGSLIGFAGCSGNAGAECRKVGVLNINSGHVHMVYQPAQGGAVDPLTKVGWALRFAEIEQPIDKQTWEDEGQLLDEAAPPDFKFGTLRTENARATERIKKTADPSRLLPPFETIDFDDRTALARTAVFYERAWERLATTGLVDPNAKSGIADFRKSLTAIGILIERLNAIITELDAIAKAVDTTPLDIKRAHTRSAEFMFDAIRLLWLAMAGEAMLPVARGMIYDTNSGEWVAGPGTPRSGIGLGGKSILVGLGNGRAALHASFLKQLVDDIENPGKKKVAPYSRWTLSVSLGAGTSWQAIFDQKIDIEIAKLPAEMAQIFKEYYDSVYRSTYLLTIISKIICDNSKIFDGTGLKRYLASVKAMMGALAGEAEEPGEARKLQAALAEIGTTDAGILTLLRMIAQTASAAAGQAVRCLAPNEKQLDRIRSAYDLIWIDPQG